MPAFVIAQGARRTGQTIDATLCDPNAATGAPDRKTATPVKIRHVSDRVLCVDGVNRTIISSVGMNGTSTFLVDGNTRSIADRERRVALARISARLDQLRNDLLMLKDGSETPGLIVEGLALLYEWLADEHERMTAASRCVAGGRDA